MNLFNRTKTAKGQRNEDLPEQNEGLPDSDKPYGLCPRCNKQSSFETLGFLPATFGEGFSIDISNNRRRVYNDRVTSFQCRNCNQPIIVIEEEYVGELPSREKNTGGTISWRGFFWWPFLNVKLSDDIPVKIQKILQEAKITYSTQCYRASAVMSRRVLEAIAVDKGVLKGNLAEKIKILKENGNLDKNLFDWATEIRLIGNVGAHFDPIEDVEKEDANQIILFIEELIKYLYIMPAEIEKRRKRKS